jgi:catechol 2,3-dioxygenase-like lactoylglutathione lyase family enzyme
MLNYATVGTNSLPEALAFYDGLLGTIGWKAVFEHPSGGRIYGKPGKSWFGVLGPANGEAATVGNGSMFGFAMDSVESVEAFYGKALALGGTCEGAPGKRGGDNSPMTFGYFRDLDGNKLCAYHLATKNPDEAAR